MHLSKWGFCGLVPLLHQYCSRREGWRNDLQTGLKGNSLCRGWPSLDDGWMSGSWTTFVVCLLSCVSLWLSSFQQSTAGTIAGEERNQHESRQTGGSRRMDGRRCNESLRWRCSSRVTSPYSYHGNPACHQHQTLSLRFEFSLRRPALPRRRRGSNTTHVLLRSRPLGFFFFWSSKSN